ncbi:ATP-dependent DNA ligase [Arthrobacter sp. zg-Y820]|uniref:ATP-dependent DNA ligase n=1 Tax=unclassified Arthrobacter TaxID=235627 RepID=UPI001E597CA4|nr:MULTISPECIES: ATP-dependent DNA ligase [unclassified Arthrobacter]MCC9197415.1 ATP-dependent DNA ligase [Arthrobacter sp. zg-Y820]MDK1280282.1 ATP-dependent DNA ligase [Arthrobacter sp. zg.Y820]WIB09569.1 ATP-dependent DNA ligase [Arthrobacter sp. zg-Y820]
MTSSGAGLKQQETVNVDGHRLRLTNLDKVLYPETGTTKADVLTYYAAVAEALLPHSHDRPATRKRWVHGVGTPDDPGQVFFQKNIDTSAPTWVKRFEIEHKTSTNIYPLVNDLATLTWLAQSAALEIHVPQWRFGPRGKIKNPDRLVLDLDPGEGVDLAQCAEVARLARDILSDMGLEARPVTSGSKGIHLYAALDGRQSSSDVSAVAHELARALEADHPDLIVSDMKKSLRTGKVLLDWSQNNANKTTICPYSLRGRFTPTVAAPRTWEELEDPDLAQLDYEQVMQRLADHGDPLAGMDAGELDADALEEAAEQAGAVAEGGPADRLSKYRSMRDAAKTPEPVPEEPAETSEGNSFVIQEHHARRLHWDFRLEHDGVLVSWALPKGPPDSPNQNHLAVQTEDHPLDYGSFEGTIPKGEYGAGEVRIWDHGTYEREKWRDGKEVIAVLHGQPDGGLASEGSAVRRFALIHTGGQGGANNWLIHLMKHQPPAETEAAPKTAAQAGEPDAPDSPEDSVAAAAAAPASGKSLPDAAAVVKAVAADAAENGMPSVEPMLATLGTRADVNNEDEWAFEMKWDGVRAIVDVTPEGTRLISRNGNDMTAAYPELQELGRHLNGERAVLDGEIVAISKAGRPDFGLLQPRMHLTKKREINAAAARTPVHLMLFDLLWLDGNSLMDLPYAQRREILAQAVEPAGEDGHVQVPPALELSMDDAVESSRELGLEGVMAKRLKSTYSSGSRSKSWIKLKNSFTQEVVIVGWRPGKGNRASKIGSLLVAVPDGHDLTYIGRVGSGLSEKDLALVGGKLKKLARKTAPLDDVPAADASDAQWVRPVLVGEVTFSERTAGGKLRHPAWRGLRPDKKPSDVVVEAP